MFLGLIVMLAVIGKVGSQRTLWRDLVMIMSSLSNSESYFYSYHSDPSDEKLILCMYLWIVCLHHERSTVSWYQNHNLLFLLCILWKPFPYTHPINISLWCRSSPETGCLHLTPHNHWVFHPRSPLAGVQLWVATLGQSEASIQVTWSLWTNQRPAVSGDSGTPVSQALFCPIRGLNLHQWP